VQKRLKAEPNQKERNETKSFRIRETESMIRVVPVEACEFQ